MTPNPDFTGEKCPAYVAFATTCVDKCEDPSPADIATICKDWASNEECYESTQAVPDAFEGFRGACTSGTFCAPAPTLNIL